MAAMAMMATTATKTAEDTRGVSWEDGGGELQEGDGQYLPYPSEQGITVHQVYYRPPSAAPSGGTGDARLSIEDW